MDSLDVARRGPLHGFVDESKRRGFSLVRCDVPADQVHEVRADLRALLRAGQRRIHFRKESNAVRQAVLDIVVASNVTTSIYTSLAPEPTARQACLKALIGDAQDRGVALVVIELDDSFMQRDRHTIHDAVAANRRPIRWQHARSPVDPGLWLPDAVGWCLDSPDPKWKRALSRIPLRRVDV